MSVQSKKKEMGYTKECDRSRCGTCAHRTYLQKGLWNNESYETGHRCTLGGFAVQVKSVCDHHKPGKGTAREE